MFHIKILFLKFIKYLLIYYISLTEIYAIPLKATEQKHFQNTNLSAKV